MRRLSHALWAVVVVVLLVGSVGSGHALALPLSGRVSPSSGPSFPVPVATELIGQIGGATYALDVAGAYAYVGIGSRIVVLDVTNPASPHKIGQSAILPGLVEDVHVSGSLLIVALGEAGVQVLDISMPEMPMLRGKLDTSGDVRRLALAPDRIYATDSTGRLQIIGMADADHLTWLGSYPGQARNVAVVGQIVYLLRGTRMLVLNASNPANPTVLGMYESTAYLEAVTVINGLAYLAASTQGLEIVDVSNPAAPVYVGHLVTPGSANGIAVSGSLAYLTAAEDGLQVIDIHNAASPQWLDTYAYPSIGAVVRLSNNHAYIAGKDKNLVILNVAHPGMFMDETTFDLPAKPQRLRVEGTRAYLADSDDGLWIMDVSDPLNPTPLSVYHTPEGPLNITVEGSIAYVADGDSGLLILDVSDANHPMLLGSYDTVGYAFDVAIANGVAFVADGPRLSVINVSQPTAPTLVAVLGLRDARSVDIEGSLMYVADFRSPRGLRIFNISNPAAPALLSTYHYDGTAGEARVHNGVAYIAQTVGLETADVISSTAPSRLASLPLPGNSYSVAVAEPYAFVASGLGGLQIVDVNNPAQPQVTGVMPMPGSARGVALQGDVAYVAADAGGLMVVRTTTLPQASPWFLPLLWR
jgi:hypothetical protein